MSKIEDVRCVAVLGAGTMGHGIAQVAAMAGWEVMLRDVEMDFVDKGLERIRHNLDKGVERKKVDAALRDETLVRLTGTTSIEEAVAEADVVIEAIPEHMELKQETFAAVDKHAPDSALLASNTSSLSLATIAKSTSRPQLVVGMHFFNPVHIMKLVEVVRHDGSSDAAVELAQNVALKMQKTPIVVKDVAGFASSRLGIALGMEAIRMVEQGVASAVDIDTAMTLGYGHPMGPLELTDLVGLDVRLAIARYLQKEIGPAFCPPPLLAAMVKDGKLGKKSGQGFYRWQDGKAVK